jgi:lysophospholipase L1-like esterase
MKKISPHLKYLALGDSYTIGEALNVEDSWPMQWADALRKNDLAIESPGIIAKTGWTTDELAEALDEADSSGTLTAPYGLVSLSIGVNNHYRARDITNYSEEFSSLLTRAISYAGDHKNNVVVLSIPDWGITPFGKNSGRDVEQIAVELDAYNQTNAIISQNRGVNWVDISAVTREAGNHAACYADDGLHPSSTLYALWVKELLKIKTPSPAPPLS